MKPIHFREQDFKREVEKQPYSKPIREEFFEYWSEPDRAQSPKMRFEKEKTWDLGRRLARWARKNNEGKAALKINGEHKPQTEIECLDALLNAFEKNYEKVDFGSLAEWYEYLVRMNLMKTFYPVDVEEIREIHKGDKTKCRAECVKRTIVSYINTGMTFSQIMKIRERLNVSNAG